MRRALILTVAVAVLSAAPVVAWAASARLAAAPTVCDNIGCLQTEVCPPLSAGVIDWGCAETHPLQLCIATAGGQHCTDWEYVLVDGTWVRWVVHRHRAIPPAWPGSGQPLRAAPIPNVVTGVIPRTTAGRG